MNHAPENEPNKTASSPQTRARGTVGGFRERIPGGASPAGTEYYFKKRGSQTLPPIRFGKTGWSASPIGFGGYRIHQEADSHRQALRLALSQGSNLLDTSTNYTDGSSETLIGEVLAELIGTGELERDQVIVVTKVGYVQGRNLDVVREREASGRPFPEIVEFDESLAHCISPEFIEDQLTRSLERLGLEKLDVLLLHNPEYFLKANEDHREYYARIRRAFAHLEKEVARGRIQYYGISSNTFGYPKQAHEFTSLEAVLELAREITPEPKFGVIQFPFNLYELGPVFEENNSGKSVTELAFEAGLATLINRPLNAFAGNRLIRLADFKGTCGHSGIDLEESLKEALTSAMSLESQYPGRNWVPAQKIAWGHILKQNIGSLLEIEAWNNVLAYQIRPTLGAALSVLKEHEETRDWAARYEPASEKLFAVFGQFVENEAAMHSRRIAARLDQAAPLLKSSRTLSQKALRIYRSLPGIQCVLVGMRRPEYVRDALTVSPPLPPEQALDALEALEEMIRSADENP